MIAAAAQGAVPGLPAGQSGLAAQALSFAEPLVPTAVTSAEEDAALQAAITGYQKAGSGDSFAPLEDFLAGHPHSGWNTAVLTNLGRWYFRYGYLSKSLGAFEQAWASGKSAEEVHARALVDSSLGQLLFLQTRLGDAATLQALLNEVGSRSLAGSATEQLAGARQRLWYLTNTAVATHSSAPSPLGNLLSAVGAATGTTASSATPRTTLAQLATLATQAGLASRAMYRAGGAAVPIPVIVHWKVNHFAAIVGRRGDGYEVLDPAFGQTARHITAGALEAEASGFFLVPNGQAASGWRNATDSESNQVYGIGLTR